MNLILCDVVENYTVLLKVRSRLGSKARACCNKSDAAGGFWQA